MEYFENNFTVE